MADFPNDPPEHVDAIALLGQLRSLHSSTAEAVSRAAGTASQTRLNGTLGAIAAAEAALSLALQSGKPLAPGDLAAIASLIQGAESAVRSAELEAASETARAAQDMAAASAATRQETQGLARDLFERRIFDPFLHFASPKDEEEYRARDAERQRAIAAQLARHTAEGDLNAGGIAAGQMLDAHAHGAGASPEFLPRWNSLVEKLHRQREAMRAAGQSTAAFDTAIDAEVRSYLAAKGLSPAEIEARMSSGSSPLDVVRPFISSERDARTLDRTLWDRARAERAPEPTLDVQVQQSSMTLAASELDLDAMTASLRAAGVQLAEAPPPLTGHGLSDRKSPSTDVTVPPL